MAERYEIRGKIGQGGVGAVYRAYDNQLGREVAIKRLLPPEESEVEDPAMANLDKEAGFLSRLQHPNIITLYDVGTDEDGGYVVMELLDGETIEDAVRRGALGMDDFVAAATQALEGLEAAQNLGLLHRDIKPSNIMINWLPTGTFQLKLLDFGLAKFSPKPALQTIDQSDSILGSIYFLAPEQFERRPLDPRTDVYALGCVFYYTLTQRYPFTGENPVQVMTAHLDGKAEELGDLRPDLPPAIAAWVMRMISREMEHRPANARMALDEFVAAQAGQMPPEVPAYVSDADLPTAAIAEPEAPAEPAAPPVGEPAGGRPATGAVPQRRKLITGTQPTAATAAPTPPKTSTGPRQLKTGGVAPTVSAPKVSAPGPTTRHQPVAAPTAPTKPGTSTGPRQLKTGGVAPKVSAPGPTTRQQPVAAPTPTPGTTTRHQPLPGAGPEDGASTRKKVFLGLAAGALALAGIAYCASTGGDNGPSGLGGIAGVGPDLPKNAAWPKPFLHCHASTGLMQSAEGGEVPPGGEVTVWRDLAKDGGQNWMQLPAGKPNPRFRNEPTFPTAPSTRPVVEFRTGQILIAKRSPGPGADTFGSRFESGDAAAALCLRLVPDEKSAQVFAFDSGKGITLRLNFSNEALQLMIWQRDVPSSPISVPCPAGEWFVAVLSWDQTMGDLQLRIARANGVRDEAARRVPDRSLPTINTVRIGIGGNNRRPGANTAFEGDVAEIIAFDHPLTEGEATALLEHLAINYLGE